LATQLREVRRRTHRLVEDLSPDELTERSGGGRPLLWRVGEVGWFHEYWTLRHVHGEAPLREDGDRLWKPGDQVSSPLPDLETTLGYLDEVLKRQLDQLERSNLGDDVRYFYDLALRHEDMQVEALTSSRQILGCQPPDLGDIATEGAGPYPGDAAVPGGPWRLGASPQDGFVYDNEKWAHTVELAPFRIAQAPVTNLEFAVFVAEGGYRRSELWSDSGWA
jgi:iron(II)-dependent oxidoreductase